MESSGVFFSNDFRYEGFDDVFSGSIGRYLGFIPKTRQFCSETFTIKALKHPKPLEPSFPPSTCIKYQKQIQK